MRWFQAVALEHFFHRMAEADFGPRISEFGLKPAVTDFDPIGSVLVAV